MFYKLKIKFDDVKNVNFIQFMYFDTNFFNNYIVFLFENQTKSYGYIIFQGLLFVVIRKVFLLLNLLKV